MEVTVGTDETLEQLLREVRELRERIDAPALPAALTIARAAQELSVSVRKLREMIAEGRVLTCEIGRTRMVPRTEIERLATPQQAAPKARAARAAPRRGGAKSEAAKLREALRPPRRR